MRGRISLLIAVMMLFSYGNTIGGTWTTLDMSGAYGTYANGIDGSNIVGWYQDASGSHGFLYNGSSAVSKKVV
jgi:hypothetical protein